jgi:hypothetical protein
MSLGDERAKAFVRIDAAMGIEGLEVCIPASRTCSNDQFGAESGRFVWSTGGSVVGPA